MPNVDNVRSESELTKENAFTNNTFNLPIIEETLKSTVENSFNYLKKLQASYIDLKKFVRSEDDFYLDSKNNLCLSLDADFIEVNKRKRYRLSEYYDTFIDLETIQNNKDLFSYTPLVLIDGESIFSFEVRSSLDGNTVLKFNHVKYMKRFLNSLHTVEVIFFKNSDHYVIQTNMNGLISSDWKINHESLGFEFKENTDMFLLFQPTDGNVGSNMYPVDITEDNDIIIDSLNDNIYDLYVKNENVNVHILQISNMRRLSLTKPIRTRVDNGRLSSTFVLPEEKVDNSEKSKSSVLDPLDLTYKMAIPEENIILLKMDKNTKEITYESNKDIILHYPNIYEVMCDNLSTNYELIVYYLYKDVDETFKHANVLKYIYRYLCRKLMKTTVEDAVCQVIYDDITNQELKQFILDIMDYKPSDFIYNHKDFFATHVPYTLDYKISKMKEFIGNDPYVLQTYGEKVGTPNERYYVQTKNINLDERRRKDTSKEVKKQFDIHVFDEERYLFMFRNELREELNLRIFIDGLLCQDAFQIQVGDLDYIYIPVSEITENSYIEIENFHSYQCKKKVIFESTNKYVYIEFTDEDGEIPPTLFDLIVLDKNKNKIDRRKFKIFCLIDPPMYDVSDNVNDNTKVESGYMNVDNFVYYDEESDQWFMDVDEAISNNTELYLDDQYQKSEDGTRMLLGYMFLKKLRIYCNDGRYTNTPIYFTVNKLSGLYTKKLEKFDIPLFRVNNGMPWNESSTYMRTFVNGRFIPFDVQITTEKTSDSYAEIDRIISENDTFTMDLTPYSYQLEYNAKEIPEDFIIDVGDILTKPFSLDYYDIYLNGRKLTELQIQSITPQRVKLFNVHSRKNLYIYRKDRDVEYFKFERTAKVPIDKIFESEAFTEEDINDIIDDIIRVKHPGEIIEEGEDTEPDEQNYYKNQPDTEFYQVFMFYRDYIQPSGVVKPNEESISESILTSNYKKVYDLYSNKKDRVVFRPNTRYNADAVLMIGRER